MLHPDDPDARIELAEALIVEGDAEGATKQLEKAITIAPSHRSARRVLARVHLREGRPIPAERALEEQVRRFPDDTIARDALADLLVLGRRIDDAIVHLEEAVLVDPSSYERRVRVAELSIARRLFARAKRHADFLKGLSTDDPELAKRRHAIALELCDPESLAAHVEIGRDRAIGRALEAFESPELRGQVKAGALRDAIVALRRDDIVAAKRALITASQAEQSTEAYAFLRAELSLIEGDREKAEKGYRRAVEQYAQFALAWSRLGEILSAKPSPAELASAARAFEEVLKISPDDTQAMESLGDVFARMNRRPEALRSYEKALARRPEGMLAAKIVALRSPLREDPDEGPRPGRIGALGWNAFGGTVSIIEAVAVPGKGELVFTGNVGKTGQEAAKVALSCLKARADSLGIEAAVTKNDLHLHFVDTELQKDGPSAGLALALAGFSAFTGRPLRPRLAATGEITVQGAIKSVGGLHEKLSAAYLADIEILLAPRGNLLDLKDVPAPVLRQIRLVVVNSLSEALDHALIGGDTKR